MVERTQSAVMSLPGGLRQLWATVYKSRRRVATGAAAVLAFGLGYHVVFGRNGLTAYQQKRQASVALTQETETLTRENDVLHAHVDRLRNDPDAIEHQAREGLHYTRPGEVIYTVNAAGTPTRENSAVPPVPAQTPPD